MNVNAYVVICIKQDFNFYTLQAYNYLHVVKLSYNNIISISTRGVSFNGTFHLHKYTMNKK